MMRLIEIAMFWIAALCAGNLACHAIRQLRRDYREWRREENHRCK